MSIEKNQFGGEFTINKKFPVYLVILLSMVSMNSIKAQTESNPSGPWYLTDRDSGKWYVDAWLGLETEPTYAGSNKNELELGANIRAFYKFQKGHRLFVSLEEIGGVFELKPDLQFSALLEYEEGRDDDDDDDTLTGLDEVDDTVEAQLSLSKRWGNLSIAFVFQPDLLDRGKGLVYFLGIQYDQVVKDSFRISPRLDVSFGDHEHMETEFEITPSESQRTGLKAYSPDSGLKSATLGIDLEYWFKERWSLLGQVELEHYFSEASDSPLIDDEGTDNTVEAFLGVRYRFF